MRCSLGVSTHQCLIQQPVIYGCLDLCLQFFIHSITVGAIGCQANAAFVTWNCFGNTKSLLKMGKVNHLAKASLEAMIFFETNWDQGKCLQVCCCLVILLVRPLVLELFLVGGQILLSTVIRMNQMKLSWSDLWCPSIMNILASDSHLNWHDDRIW